MGSEPDFTLVFGQSCMDFALGVFFFRIFTQDLIKLCDKCYLVGFRVKAIKTAGIVGIVRSD